MPQSEWVLTPHKTTFQVALEPAHNATHSLLMLSMVERMSGLSEWVVTTALKLAPDVRRTNSIVVEGLYHAVVPDRRFPSFPAYVDELARRPAAALRDRLLNAIVLPHHADPAGNQQRLADPASLLADVDAYLNFVQRHFGGDVDLEIEREAHALMTDPPKMQDVIVSHLRSMWYRTLAPEWERIEPILNECVSAFRPVDLSRMDAVDAARTVLGYDPPDYLQQLLARHREIIFVPSGHVGPYIGKYASGGTLWLIFGARMPDGLSARSSALDRSELLVRLNAITDDSRLRMLQLLSQQDEICAQDIMSRLDLSQSAASRHLRQLSAAGYVTERWRDGAKCYTINRRRIDETLQALARFLQLR